VVNVILGRIGPGRPGTNMVVRASREGRVGGTKEHGRGVEGSRVEYDR